MLFAIAAFSLLALASPASATGGHGDQPSADNKKVTLCHATGSAKNPYTKIEVSVSAFYNAGHIAHEGDIWQAFSYVTKGGDTVSVPAQGNTALLAFEGCEQPRVDTKIVKPQPTFADECGTQRDVFSVAPGEGYTVGPVVTGPASQSITVTVNEGYVFTDGSKFVTVSKPLFTNIDCDLPETGGIATFNTTGGYAALAGIVLVGAFMLVGSRRKIA